MGSAMNKTDHRLRRIITDAIRQCPKKRQQIAEEMERFLELPARSITVNMLNDFSSDGAKKTRFPAAFVDAFCSVVGDSRLKGEILGPRGRRLLRIGEDVSEMLAEDKRRARKS
jgi:hypothetical protein